MKSKLIIEVDGARHGETGHQHRDIERDTRLAAVGFKVLHFWNNEVNENLDGVIETIFHEATARLPPLKGEGATEGGGWGC